MDAAAQLVAGIAREFRRRMLGEYVPRIERCVGMLGEQRCWQRPGSSGNAVANLLLHLEGNVRQWILVTFTGAADARDRAAEFRAGADEPPASAAALMQRLRQTVTAAVAAVERLDAAALLQSHRIQQRFDETGLGAVLHVLEHFSGHAGQIYAFTKQVTGEDLRFYDL